MEDDQIKITVIGDSCTGKSCLLSVYKGDKYANRYSTNVLSQFQKSIIVNGRTYILNINDTTGLEEYDRARSWSYIGTDIFLICFAINDRISLDNVRQKWWPEANYYRPDAPVILVGTKSDLDDMKLTSEDINNLKKQIRAKAVIMCSSVTGQHIDKVFKESVLIIHERQKSVFNKIFCSCANGR